MPGPLAALAGEEQGDLAAPRLAARPRRPRPGDAADRPSGGPVASGGSRRGGARRSSSGQVVARPRPPRPPGPAPARRRRAGRRPARGRAAATAVGPLRPSCVQQSPRPPRSAAARSAPAEDEQLGGPGVERRAGGAPGRVRASTTWKLVPPKPNALTPATRSAGAAAQGRASVWKANGLLSASQAGVGLVQVQGRRSDAGVQGQRGLDQPGQPGGALGVPDLRLHRAQRAAARRGPGLGEHLGQGGRVRCGRRRPCRCRAPRPARPRPGETPGVAVRAVQRARAGPRGAGRSGRASGRRWSRRRP